MDIIEENKKIIKVFGLDGHGFFDICPLDNRTDNLGKIGFTARKKFNAIGESFFQTYISNEDLGDGNNVKKPIRIIISFEGGRSLENPVSLMFDHIYFYDIGAKEIYKKNKKNHWRGIDSRGI